MFKQNFVDIVNLAVQESNNFYSNEENQGQANPFYVGFGNPNSNLLILGKEKGFDLSKNEQLNFENIRNPYEWQHHIENKTPFFKEKFYESAKDYLNSYFPYCGSDNMPSGHTWNKYGKLTSGLLNIDLVTENSSFLKHAFISEINHEPSKYSKIKKFDSQTRLDFLSNDFYKSFKTTILGCGNYLSNEKIKAVFNVELDNTSDHSEPRKKLIVFKNGNRKLILTRQLSMDVSNEFIAKIVKVISE